MSGLVLVERIDSMYYLIDEKAARVAHNMNSFYTFKEGQATAEYQAAVDKAVEIAGRCKSSVDPMYHDKIDSLLDAYARKLAANMNKGFAIEARCPSVMVAGPANFPVRKKEKQNRARDANMREWRDVQGLLGKIKGLGSGGISADDPNALNKLKVKLESLENGGGAGRMASNVSAEKRRLRGRIAELERRVEKPLMGWKFNGGEVVANADANRLQILFDGKPDEALRHELKRNGFRWAPSVKAWQRQLTDNAIYAAKQIEGVRP